MHAINDSDMNDVLRQIAAVEDPQKWAPVWEILRNDGEKAEARLLIIELVLRVLRCCACSEE